MTKVCLICENPFSVPFSHADKRRTCSPKCGAEYKRQQYQKGNHGGHFKPGHPRSNTGKTHFPKGHKPSELSLIRSRESFNEKYKGKKRPERQGLNCPRWKGGITPINHAIRTSLDSVNWRRKVFERDNYTCQECGVRNGDGKTHTLHAHHIKPFYKYPELRFEVSNGKTLCKDCHLKGGSHGRAKK